MKPLDFVKALGLGVAALALNLLALVAVMFVYGQLIAPGHPQAFYNEAAPRFGAVTAPIGSVVLMFLTAWAFGRRRPERNPFAFALALFASYAVVDTGIGLAAAPVSELLTTPFILGMGGGLVAALAGAALSRRRA